MAVVLDRALPRIPGSFVLAGAAVLLAAFALRRSLTSVPPWVSWDALGLILSLSLAVMATVIIVEAGPGLGPGLLETSRAALAVSGLGLGLVVVGAASRARQERLRAGAILRALTRVWADPAADGMLLVLGAILTLPLWALHGSVVWDADSARILSSISELRHHGPAFLVASQEVWLPVFGLGTAVAVAGIGGAVAASILSAQALGATVSYIAFRLTRRAQVAVAAVLSLIVVQFVAQGAGSLPMYPAMLVLGYLSAWLALRTMRAGSRRWMWAGLTGLALAITAETHDIGKVFFAAPALLILAEPTGRGIRGVAWIYASLALFFLPRAILNISDGGLSQFAVNRTDWIVARGYLTKVNAEFWRHPVAGSRWAYLATLFGESARSVGWAGILLLPLSGIALLSARMRIRLLALLATGLLLAALLRTSAPPFPRYLAPLIPGLAIAAGIGLGRLTGAGSRVRRLVAGSLVGLLAVGAATATRSMARDVHRNRQAVLASGIAEVAARVDDGRSVMGVRPHQIHFVDPTVPIETTKRFTEEEFVTFLTWPDDRSVLNVLRRHDVGWVFVLRNRRLEVEYHQTWVRPQYGLPVRHPEALAASPAFCEALRTAQHVLYSVGPCPA